MVFLSKLFFMHFCPYSSFRLMIKNQNWKISFGIIFFILCVCRGAWGWERQRQKHGHGGRGVFSLKPIYYMCWDIFITNFFLFNFFFFSASYAMQRTELQRNGDVIKSIQILQRVCLLQSLFRHKHQGLVGTELKSSEISQVKWVLYFTECPGTKWKRTPYLFCVDFRLWFHKPLFLYF